MGGSIYLILWERSVFSSLVALKRLRGIDLLLLMFLSALGGAAHAKDKVINENPLKASLIHLTEDLKPGDEASLKVEMSLAEKHHAYLDMFRFEISGVENLIVEGFDVAPVVEFFDKFSKKKRLGIKGPAEMAVLVTVPEHLPQGEHQAQFELTYQACTDDYCLFPKKIPLEITFQVEGDKNLSPKALSVDQTRQDETAPSSSILNFNEAMNTGWWMALFVVFLAGILTSFTPCIFPMIPITLAILGTKTAGRTRLSGFFLSLIYVLGIALTYSLLGLFAASTGALFGSFLGHPIAIGFISSVFVLMGLSMFGLFEIKLPDRWATRLSQLSGQQSYLTSFVAGLFAGIVASPCVGPVLVAILTYVAKEQDLYLGFALLFTYALGLGLIFIALGTFGQLSQ
jgi:thiol:disulfide interchange protein DsbD